MAHITGMDVLARLARKDKWGLGGGKGAVSAPPFPKWLTTPGFWDECFLADLRVPRLFTLLFMDGGRPVRTRGTVLDWNPSRLRLLHKGDGWQIEETRLVTSENAFVSRLRLLRGRPLDVYLWSLLDVRLTREGAPWQSMELSAVTDDAMVAIWKTAWPSEVEPDRTGIETELVSAKGEYNPEVPLWIASGANLPRRSHLVGLAQRHDESPLYELSLLPTNLRDGQFIGGNTIPAGLNGLAHLVQGYRLQGEAVFAAGTGLTREDAETSLKDARDHDPLEGSEASWRRYFDAVPFFESDDSFLTNAYWYRWFGLRLNTVDLPSYRFQGSAQSAGPFVTEGIGFFRNFVTYSAQAHLREVAWMHHPRLATGILDNLGLVQRTEGSFPGHSYAARPSRDFYHADFGTPMTRLAELHPNTVTEDHRETLRRYADYLLSQRVRDGLADVFDQNEIGQEYMGRYAFAGERKDDWAGFRFSGVDATVYAERTFAALGLDQEAQALRQGLSQRSWDPDAAFFCDVDGVRRSAARPATGLYPLLLPGLEAQSIQAVQEWLANPDEFWLGAGFPAEAASGPTFRPDAHWRERRTNCPWNGRSWPMANSHLVEGLARLARATGDPELLRLAAEALMKSVRLMFHDGDPARPNSYEHYDPITGTASLYRGYDDYQHSWIVDLILRQGCGIGSGDPLPLGVGFEVAKVPDGKGGFLAGGTKS